MMASQNALWGQICPSLFVALNRLLVVFAFCLTGFDDRDGVGEPGHLWGSSCLQVRFAEIYLYWFVAAERG